MGQFLVIRRKANVCFLIFWANDNYKCAIKLWLVHGINDQVDNLFQVIVLLWTYVFAYSLIYSHDSTFLNKILKYPIHASAFRQYQTEMMKGSSLLTLQRVILEGKKSHCLVPARFCEQHWHNRTCLWPLTNFRLAPFLMKTCAVTLVWFSNFPDGVVTMNITLPFPGFTTKAI